MSGQVKVACITLDAAEQSLLREWASQGLLPHFGRILKESICSETRNSEIIYSGTLWPSFNTGLWPVDMIIIFICSRLQKLRNAAI